MISQLMTKFPYALKGLEEKRKEYSSDAFTTGNFDKFDSWEDYENEDCDADDDQDYLEFLKNEAQSLEYVNSETGIFGSLEDFEDLEEDPLSGSVLDEVNIYAVSYTHLDVYKRQRQFIAFPITNLVRELYYSFKETNQSQLYSSIVIMRKTRLKKKKRKRVRILANTRLSK